jgi:hypothetical protein
VEGPRRSDKQDDNGASYLWRAVYPGAFFDLERRVAVVSIGFPGEDEVVLTW